MPKLSNIAAGLLTCAIVHPMAQPAAAQTPTTAAQPTETRFFETALS